MFKRHKTIEQMYKTPIKWHIKAESKYNCNEIVLMQYSLADPVVAHPARTP